MAIDSEVGLGGIVATITTTSEFGFLVFLPIFFTRVVGFTLQQWLQILSIMFATNVIANLFWSWVGDHIGWRRTITFAGSCSCAVTTGPLLRASCLWRELPACSSCRNGLRSRPRRIRAHRCDHGQAGPESRGAAMSIMNLGSGMSTFIGPAVAGLFLPLLGVSGVIWIFAFMYLAAAGISWTLHLQGVRALR